MGDNEPFVDRWGANPDQGEGPALEGEFRQFAKRLKVQAEASRAFSEATRDYALLLDTIAKMAAEVLGDTCLIQLLSPDGSRLELDTFYDSDPTSRALLQGAVTTPIFAQDQDLSLRLLGEGEGHLVPQVTHEQLRTWIEPQAWPLLDRIGAKSLMLVPLRVSGRRIGMIYLSRYRAGHRPYVEEDLALAQDLADRAALAIENARLYVDLEARVVERTAELEAANARLREADRYKDKFLNIVSHELRNPINAITGFGSIIEDELVGPLNAQQHLFLNKMLGSADILLGLINDMLDMSKIQAGRFSLNLTTMGFADMVERVLAIMQAVAEPRRQQIINEVPTDLPALVADEQRLHQVLLNLLTNACKFSPIDGQVWVRARITGDRLRCEVSDTGAGVATADQQRVFQLYGELGGLAGDRPNGLGLGLSISKSLIEAHGGSIGVTSSPGKGATFWFEVPLHQANESR